MLRLFIGSFLLMSLAHPSAKAEEQNSILNEDNKKSSSFVVDPDPLDPLPVKRENIKDGDEIILEDIRQVIDRQPEPAVKAKSNDDGTAHGVTTTTSTSIIKKTRSKKVAKSFSPKNKKLNSTLPRYENLINDDPDKNVEDRFHSSYQKFNINPTSAELWSSVSASQKQNIYIVQKNDTLYSISLTLFGDSKFWPKIWALNRSSILNPHYIYPEMKIYFYSGDAVSLPTLSLTAPVDAPTNGTGVVPAGAVSEEDNEKYLTQDTEFQKAINRDTKGTFTDPTAIPDSLPITKNSKYTAKSEDRVEIKLKNFEYVDSMNYKNPYILTSSDLKSDFTVPTEQISNLICKENQFIPLVKKLNVDTTPGKFLIVEKLILNGQRMKKTNKYKTIGTVTINDKNQLRVSNCNGLMDLETIIVSEEKVRTINDPTEEFDFSARIIDGLDYNTQDFYAENQYLIVNLEGLNVDSGADLSIFSDVLGKRVGRLHILKRSGNVAVAVVTQVYDIINRGDLVTE